ncbi:hypothetical protein, partial [Pseudomonas rossensis]|uniref:hypothetical protein n=1 Tax=Pseudomonas rossensis TaxID=2305471 RepID=UPI003261632D
FFDFGVGTHHDGLAPERNREHSIGHQVSAWNVGFMERLQGIYQKWAIHLAPCYQATSNKQRQKPSHLANSSRLEFFHGVKCKVQKVS